MLLAALECHIGQESALQEIISDKSASHNGRSRPVHRSEN